MPPLTAPARMLPSTAKREGDNRGLNPGPRRYLCSEETSKRRVIPLRELREVTVRVRRAANRNVTLIVAEIDRCLPTPLSRFETTI